MEEAAVISNMRLIIGKTEEKNSELVCEFIKGALLSNVLRKEGVFVDMPCSGMGRCGKCRVKFLEGASVATDADRRFFSEKELEEGYRLACRAVLKEDARIELLAEDLEIGSEVADGSKNDLGDLCKKQESLGMAGSQKIVVAIDIGTTTIAASLVSNGATVTGMNHQRSFGADVISRIQASVSGNGDELRRLVLDDIRSMIYKVFSKAGLSADTEPDEVVIAGNTTMLHLLMGDSCEGLGKAPYTPVRLAYPELSYSDVFGTGAEEKSGSTGISDSKHGAQSDTDNKYAHTKVRLLPGISAFVGADIVSGMYSLGFDRVPDGKAYMLIDLGTNGEMAIAGSDRILVASTAAGPVFEGGGISCGMPGVEGAIEHVTISKGGAEAEGNGGRAYFKVKAQTIGDVKASGICGSGVLELVSELRRCEIIDETGLLMDEYFDNGFPVDEEGSVSFLQEDIRAVQLAKAAIRGGIDTLLSEYGCSAADVDKVYLAGGFSEHISPENIRYLNILPGEFVDGNVISCIGNASLFGCIKVAEDDSGDDLQRIVSKSREVVLATEDAFSEAFLENMNF